MRRFIASVALVLTMVLGLAGGAVPSATAGQSSDAPCQLTISHPIAVVFIPEALKFLPILLNVDSPGAQVSVVAQTQGDSGASLSCD